MTSFSGGDWAIYLDGNVPFGGPQADAYTDLAGEASFMLAAGAHTVRFYKVTGSHTYELSSGYSFIVRPSEQTTEQFVIQSGENKFKSYYDVTFGKALYVTGSTSLLGDWKTAFKLDYQTWCGCWHISEKLLKNLEYKIVMADWVNEN
ncbi:MAG: hypothetical protein HRT38_16925 [Alteromonadaceae bacterium]|nr:hypothetical protein [Alteromonadaceae bacterium]